MKIAGRKNDGAWFRTNKVIKALSVSQRLAFQVQLGAMTSLGAYYEEVIERFANLAGMAPGDPGYPDSPQSLVDIWGINGIPRQVWMGLLSYDTYVKTTVLGVDKYTPMGQATAHALGKEIRELCKDFMMARRQALDLSNTESRAGGNPGGIANATEGD